MCGKPEVGWTKALSSGHTNYVYDGQDCIFDVIPSTGVIATASPGF
jgi:hypothetical protein